jgi:general secretion pathway protein G
MDPRPSPPTAAPTGQPPARRPRRAGKGFTLLELVYAVAVVGVLAMLAVSGYHSYRDRVDFAKAVFDIGHISNEIRKFVLDNRAQPDSLAEVGLAGMRDPWGNAYQYVNHEDLHTRGRWRRDKNIVPINSDFDVFSMGKDGVSRPPLTAAPSRDDVVRANNGSFVGLASDYDP